MNLEEINKAIRTQLSETSLGLVSDGYHTFEELYRFRMILSALLFREWAISERYEIHKSLRHSDGSLCFGGDWFIVVASLPTGQVSFHYKKDDWELFPVQERAIAVPFDGHDSVDAGNRLMDLVFAGFPAKSIS